DWLVALANQVPDELFIRHLVRKRDQPIPKRLGAGGLHCRNASPSFLTLLRLFPHGRYPHHNDVFPRTGAPKSDANTYQYTLSTPPVNPHGQAARPALRIRSRTGASPPWLLSRRIRLRSRILSSEKLR